jgi:predicted transcriptional regulator
MVSEADLLLKEEATVAPTARRRQRGRVARLEARKSAGTTAMELMTSPAVTVTPDDPLGVAARRMHEGGYRSMPVVNAEGRIIGIVSRRDLLRAFLRPDESILREIEDEVLPSVLEVEPGAVSVSVKEGVVSLRGQVERASMIPILIRLVHGVDGVVQVYEHLTFGFDDTHLRPDIRTPWGVVPRAV